MRQVWLSPISSQMCLYTIRTVWEDWKAPIKSFKKPKKAEVTPAHVSEGNLSPG